MSAVSFSPSVYPPDPPPSEIREAARESSRDAWPFQTQVTDDLAELLQILPPSIRVALEAHPQLDQLIEVVMDLGRRPEARFPREAHYLSESPIGRTDLDYTIQRVGEFSTDNRAGIESTLHRISAMRNRQGAIIGLTCRVGRCVIGVISIIRDLVELGRSLLLMGRPGVGKTTALREIARVLADDFHKRVVIIDTSNEIAGDGDIPHPGIGRARRMQVATPELQHKVMIEAVENHMPEVVVIDEIGTELEALASRTIAERGVQLVATAHGNQIANLIKNPMLADLVGGIQSVTLGDEEARRRGSQKSVLERKAPPTFEIAVEMLERTRWVVHEDVATTVDQLLRGREASVQIRSLDDEGRVVVSRPQALAPQWPPSSEGSRGSHHRSGGWRRSGRMEAPPFNPLLGRDSHQMPLAVSSKADPQSRLMLPSEDDLDPAEFAELLPDAADYGAYGADPQDQTLVIYPYGVSRDHIQQVAQTFKLQVEVTKEMDMADVILALRSQVRNRSKIQQLAQARQIPIHTVKSNTLLCVTRTIRRLLNLDPGADSMEAELDLLIQAAGQDEAEALEEARLAVEQIVIPKAQPVELLPRTAIVRRLQHELVEHYHLKAESFGEEPHRRLRIYPERGS